MNNFSVLECPVYFDKTNMLDMLSLSAGRAILCQNRLGEQIIADNSWGLDPMKGMIRFGEREFRAGILGSESEIQNTWLWSWAHTESGLPDSSTAVSCGVSHENICYYRCPYDGGAALVTISGLPEDIFAPVDSTAFLRQYIEIISGFYCDHRLLAAGFLYQNGTPFTESENALTADFGERNLRFLFEQTEDGISRVLDISEA